MNKLTLLLTTITLPCLGMHNYRNLPTIGQDRAASAQRFDWASVAGDEPETKVDAEQKKNTEMKTALNYAQLVDDELFSAIGLPKVVQQIIREYQEPSITVMPAFMFKRAIKIPSYTADILILSNDYFATTIKHGNSIEIHDMHTGAIIRELRHPDPVTSVTNMPNGWVVSATDHRIHIWNFHTGEKIQTFIALNDHITTLINDRIITAHDNELSVWDVQTGKEIQLVKIPTLLPNTITNLVPLKDELLVRTEDGDLFVWHPQAGLRKLALSLKSKLQTISAYGLLLIVEPRIQVTPKSTLPSSPTTGKSIKLYDVKQDKFLETVFVDKEPCIAGWNETTQQLDILSINHNFDPPIHKPCGLIPTGLSSVLIECDQTKDHDQTSHSSLYLYNLTQKKHIKVLRNSSTIERATSLDNKTMIIRFANRSPSGTMVEWQGICITLTEQALTTFNNLTLAKQQELEQFIAQLDKHPGPSTLWETEPFELTGSMLEQFLAFPEPIRRCLKSWYNITETSTEKNKSSCVIS